MKEAGLGNIFQVSAFLGYKATPPWVPNSVELGRL
jgi:hypothetical protein